VAHLTEGHNPPRSLIATSSPPGALFRIVPPMRKTLLTLLCATALFGCDKGKKNESEAKPPVEQPGGGTTVTPPTTPPPTTPEAQAPSPGEMGLKLLDPGAEPRKELRYKVAKGTKQAFEGLIDIAMTMNIGPMQNMKLPTMRMVGSLEFTDVTPDGKMKYVMVTEKIEFLETKGTAPLNADMLNKQFANKLNGMKATGEIDPLGKVSNFAVDMSSVPKEMQEMLQGLRQSLNQMAAPLPTEAIGKGARWQVNQNLDQDGIKVNQTVVYELGDVKDSEATLKSTVTLNAPSQTISKSGVSVQLNKMTGTGTGTMKIDFTKLLGPTEMTLHIDQDAAAMGQNMKMGMDMKVKMGPK